MTRENLDRAAKNAIRRHRERRLGLYLEAILSDYIAQYGVQETRRRLQEIVNQLAEFG